MISNEIQSLIPSWLEKSATIHIMVVDPNGIVEHINERFTYIFGYLESEVKGKHLAQFLHPKDATDFDFETIIKKVPKEHRRFRLLVRGGTKVWETEWEIAPLFDYESSVATRYLFLGQLPSVSEVEDLEKLEQIRKNLEYLETWFDHSTDAIYITDDEGKILFINAEAQRRNGQEPDELIGTGINLIEPVFQNIEDWNAHIAHLRHVGSMIIEGTGKSANGSTFPVEATMTYRESDEKSYVVSFIRNISDRKKAEMEIRTTLDLVSEQNKRLLNFNFIVSHNIRSHASNIKGLSDLLVTSVNEDERNHLKTLLRIASNNLMTTIDDLNRVVTIQRNVNIERTEIKVLESIEHVVSMLKGELHHNNVLVELNISPDHRISFNSDYFDSMLLNLMSNAIRYKNPGVRPSLRLSSTSLDDSLVLEVADNGLGIDLNRYGDKLFTMYKTFHGNPDARGLGLFITKNQIEALGGKIDVESTPSEGTTFRVTFPCNN